MSSITFPGFCVKSSEVASLVDPQLGQPVLHHYPPLPVLAKGFTLLQGPGLLQQRFLRVQPDRTSCARCCGHALGPQRAYPANCRVEAERYPLVNAAC